MNMNPAVWMKLLSAKKQFEQTHPRVAPFARVVLKQGVVPGTVIEVKVTQPNGRELSSNIRVRPEDLELFENLKELLKEQ